MILDISKNNENTKTNAFLVACKETNNSVVVQGFKKRHQVANEIAKVNHIPDLAKANSKNKKRISSFSIVELDNNSQKKIIGTEAYYYRKSELF